MTPALREALVWLLEDFRLEDCLDIVTDDAKRDLALTGGFSGDHPRVKRFTEVVEILRAVTGDRPASGAGGVHHDGPGFLNAGERPAPAVSQEPPNQ